MELSTRVRLALALILGLACLPAGAQESRWTLRGSVYGLDSAGDRVRGGTSDPAETLDLSTSSGTGIGLDLEYRLGRRLGLELSALVGDLGTDITIEGGARTVRASQDFDFEMLTFGANYHFTPEARADVYAGVLAAIVYEGDIVYPIGGNPRGHILRFDDDTGFGVRIGVDVRLAEGRPWILSAGARWVSLILEDEAGPDPDLNPLIVSVGVGYRF